MQDKNGCLNCHFLCLISVGRDGLGINPLPGSLRNRIDLLALIKKLDLRMRMIKCFHGYWDAARIGVKNTAEIENSLFRKDRGINCPLFSLYNSQATLEAVINGNKRTEEVIDRKKTRILAWVAIGISALATLLAAILPLLLSRLFTF